MLVRREQRRRRRGLVVAVSELALDPPNGLFLAFLLFSLHLQNIEVACPREPVNFVVHEFHKLIEANRTDRHKAEKRAPKRAEGLQAAEVKIMVCSRRNLRGLNSVIFRFAWSPQIRSLPQRVQRHH